MYVRVRIYSYWYKTILDNYSYIIYVIKIYIIVDETPHIY